MEKNGVKVKDANFNEGKEMRNIDIFISFFEIRYPILLINIILKGICFFGM
uniref:hypothetical protein n=1 Tax=Flavobacterium sp. TaxID=239 RepID=UPI00404B3EE8